MTIEKALDSTDDKGKVVSGDMYEAVHQFEKPTSDLAMSPYLTQSLANFQRPD